MANTRSIQSPGVQVSEIDMSVRPVTPVGTSVLIAGFAQQGPTEEVFAINNMQEFELVYGKATNPAERYFYQTAKAVFNSDSRLMATRLPYGQGEGLGVGEDYTALFFPVYSYQGAFSGNSTNDKYGGVAATYANGGTLDDNVVTNPWTCTLSDRVSATTAGKGVSLSAITGDDRTNVVKGDVGSAVVRGLSAGYIFGKPSLVRLSKEEYQALRSSNFDWDNFVEINPTFSNSSSTWGQAGMIVTNIAKSTINDRYEGFYMGLTDNSQMNPATDFDSITGAYSVNANSQDLTLQIPAQRLNFPLSGSTTSNDNSVSETLEGLPKFDISGLDFDDTLLLGIFKLRTSVFSTDTLKLDYVLSEGYIGSLDSHRKLQNPGGGQPETFFLGDVEDGSANVEVFVNPYLSFHTGTWSNANGTNPSKFARILTKRALADAGNATLSGNFGGVPQSVLQDLVAKGMKPADNLVPLGYYQPVDTSTRVIGGVPGKLSRIFRSIDNLDLVNIDITCESGLGTVYYSSHITGTRTTSAGDAGGFDDEKYCDIGSVNFTSGVATGLYQTREGAVTSTDSTNGYMVQQFWRSVHNEFVDFAENNRKDHIHIPDAPRHIFVQGHNDKVMDWEKRRTFTQFVYWPLRHVMGSTNSSYVASFGNWGRCYDQTGDRLMWCPFSGYAAATMANTDSVYGPWYAPAGFTRGRFGGVTDIAVIPTQKHRDQLYKININPVTNFPGEGFVIFGQKTMFKKPSAFDRINVRRLFLHLEKMVRQSMKYYVFEPNNLLTRSLVLNNLTPQFEVIKNAQGLFDYLIICDERNNGPAVIDNNELVVDIYVKPVRAAEIILVNFFATRTGQDFNEIMS